MSEVKRWNVEPDEQDGPCSIWNVESKDGEFVLYEDYAALQQKLDAAEVEKTGAEERCRMMFDAKNHWADRARAAEAKLAELVPAKKSTDIDYAYYPLSKARREGYNECVDDILRNIKEAK